MKFLRLVLLSIALGVALAKEQPLPSRRRIRGARRKLTTGGGSKDVMGGSGMMGAKGGSGMMGAAKSGSACPPCPGEGAPGTAKSGTSKGGSQGGTGGGRRRMTGTAAAKSGTTGSKGGSGTAAGASPDCTCPLPARPEPDCVTQPPRGGVVEFQENP